MSSNISNNKRIAKNTLFLYFRMLFMMAISLYTNRIVLDKLGVTDFGIYNVVGGVVVMLGFLSGCMSNSVQRYLSYEIGKGDKERVNKIFNVSIFVHVSIAIVVFILMEGVGLWYLNTHMNIPFCRMDAANWVFQCSLLTTLFSIMQVPYNAMIIAKEKMSIYAYISILEVSLKLLVVYFLAIGTFDRLKLYGILIMIVTISVLSIYRVYCLKSFDEAKFKFIRDWKLFKELVSFSGWNMLSEIAWTFTGPGVNLILNSFWGPAINAARGLAEQVNGAVSRFVSNFQTAVNPQLIKLYAQDSIEEMLSLLFRSTRFSFYLLYALSLPIIIEMRFILSIWLKEVPQYTAEFCQLILICSLVSVNSTLLPRIAWAYGRIKKYQIIVSLVLFMNFPLSYVVLKIGCSPLMTSFVAIVVQIVVIWVRLYLVSEMVKFSKFDYFQKAILNTLCVAVSSLIAPILLKIYLPESSIGSIFIMIISVLSVSVMSFRIGMEESERTFIKEALKKLFFNKLKRKSL